MKPSEAQIGGSHYKSDPIQHCEYVMKNQIPWCEAAAIKYLIRHRKKNGVQDLDKALHYVLLAREHYYPEAPPFTLEPTTPVNKEPQPYASWKTKEGYHIPIWRTSDKSPSNSDGKLWWMWNPYDVKWGEWRPGQGCDTSLWRYWTYWSDEEPPHPTEWNLTNPPERLLNKTKPGAADGGAPQS